MRPNTELPITIQEGTNRLCTPENLENLTEMLFSSASIQISIPELWDGHTTERVVAYIRENLRVTASH